ncbi:MAG: ABC transporter substrate-binding protein [Planctomycetota bacterium]|nr:ABC transporter substrate-binding protein [Planctomycetota bacterium]
MLRRSTLFAALMLAVFSATSLFAQQSFKELVGNVSVQPVNEPGFVNVPFITWGGDVATFHANGNLNTQASSIFKQSQLNVKLTPGDDFVGQVKNYLSGKSPFLRGTFRMIGQASEVVGADPRTKPVIVLQLSWSAGDHIIAREGIKSLNDLKGKKIACQQGGPHVGLLYDSMAAAQLSNKDVEIVWTKDLTGPDGAAELFRKDQSVDACCVITPDLLGLTGGFDTVGSGAEGTVEGAHVINSTQSMSRSIADVYAVRKDWYDSNKDWVKKFVAGYMKATEQVVKMRNSFEDSQRLNNDYRQLLTKAQTIFGEEVLPTLEIDAHGLLLDCTFTGNIAGQIAFFNDKGNLSGFESKLKESLDLATQWGYASSRRGFDPNDFDYRKIADIAGIEYKEPVKTRRFENQGESADLFLDDELDNDTIVSFTISFEPNQNEFSADRYGAEFERALKGASTFGNARIVVRGHSDPTLTLRHLVQTGESKGVIRKTGTKENRKYFYNGRPMNVNDIPALIKLIETGAFSGGDKDPMITLQAAKNLSKQRADRVRDALAAFAKSRGVNFDISQIAPVGAGIADPVIPKPTTLAEAKENMRVEFRIVRVDAETVAPDAFDF